MNGWKKHVVQKLYRHGIKIKMFTINTEANESNAQVLVNAILPCTTLDLTLLSSVERDPFFSIGSDVIFFELLRSRCLKCGFVTR